MHNKSVKVKCKTLCNVWYFAWFIPLMNFLKMLFNQNFSKHKIQCIDSTYKCTILGNTPLRQLMSRREQLKFMYILNSVIEFIVKVYLTAFSFILLFAHKAQILFKVFVMFLYCVFRKVDTKCVSNKTKQNSSLFTEQLHVQKL